MPASIALYMKEALAEDKFGHEFNSRIAERVEEMNAAQLQGIYNHLLATSRSATTEFWRNTNKELIGHVEGLMRERVGEVDKARAIKEEAIARESSRDKLKIMRRNENARVIIAVRENARNQAEDEITTKEKQRKREERTELVLKNAYLEEARDKFYIRLAIVYGISSLLIIVVFSLPFMAAAVGGANGGIIGGWMGISTIATGYIAYKKFTVSVIYPKVVTEDELEEMIEEREEAIRDDTMQRMAAEKKAFKAAMAREKIERRERRRIAKEKEAYEAKLLADLAAEQAAAAAEVLGDEFSITKTESVTGDSDAVGDEKTQKQEERKEESSEEEVDEEEEGDEESEYEEGDEDDEEEVEGEEEEDVSILSLPWEIGGEQRALGVSIASLKVTVKGVSSTSSIRAEAFSMALSRRSSPRGGDGNRGGGGESAAGGGAGDNGTSIWTSIGSRVVEEGAKGGADSSADSKTAPSFVQFSFSSPAKSDGATSFFSMDSTSRVKIMVQSKATGVVSRDIEQGGDHFTDLGVFEFTLSDVMSAWTARAADPDSTGEKRSNDLQVEGHLLSPVFESLGLAQALIRMRDVAK
jgi:hypothetical protein